jgi:glycosyltransferase involved in cell wall biosynthesis
LGITNADPLLVWVGRLDPVKGLDELIAAFARVRARRPCNLIFVGDGAYRPHIEAAIRSAGQTDTIRLLGARSDVPAVLKSADIFVFPSRTEGMPNALLEAMTAGLPCISADVPGCRDVIQDGVDGILVPARHPSALACAIERLLEDAGLRHRLGDAAATKMVMEFNLANTHDAYLSLYDEVVSC